MPSNIEKSAFRPGEYVGYAGGIVWRISRTNSSWGKWIAYPQLLHTSTGKVLPNVYSFTLAQMGEGIKRAFETA